MTGQVGGPSAFPLTGFHRERTGEGMFTLLAFPALFAVTPPTMTLSVTYRINEGHKIRCDFALESSIANDFLIHFDLHCTVCKSLFARECNLLHTYSTVNLT